MDGCDNLSWNLTAPKVAAVLRKQDAAIASKGQGAKLRAPKRKKPKKAVANLGTAIDLDDNSKSLLGSKNPY